MTVDPYQILGVARDAAGAAIKAAYRKLSRQHHPDRGGDGEKMAEINRAYEILSSPERRDRWDRTGDDRGPTRTLEDEARAIIMGLAHEHFEKAPEDVTLIESIRSNLQQLIDSLPDDRRKLEKRRRRYDHWKAKFRGPVDGDFLQGLIEQQVSDIARMTGLLETREKALEVALTLLNEFSDVLVQQSLLQRPTVSSTGGWSWP